MKKIVFLSLTACMGFALSAAFTPEEARRVYGIVSTNSPASVMEAGGFVFMELKWDIPADSSSDDKAELELTAISDALERYILPVRQAITNSPFSSALTEWLDPEVPYQIPNVPSTVVKVVEQTNSCLKVFAFDALPLKAARAKAHQTEAERHSRTSDKWLKRLKAYYATIKKEEDRRQFFVLLGCPVVNLVEGKGNCSLGKSVKGAERGLAEMDILVNWKTDEKSFYSKHPDVLWSSCVSSGGKLFYPTAWKEDDGGDYAAALKLCRQKDWIKQSESILDLLAKSIAANPISAQKWLYLGGVLAGTGRSMDGLVAYVQSARMDSDNLDSWEGIMRCCEALGLRSNAQGLKWFLKLDRNPGK